MDFRIKVKADLDSSDLQSQINKLSKENLKINIKLNDENIQSQIKQLTKDETKDIAVNIAVKNAEKLQQVNKLADQIVKTVNGQNLGIQIDNKQALSAIKQVEKASEQATKQAAKAQQTLSNAYWKNQFQSVGQKSPILSEMSAYYQQLEKEAQQVEKISKILNSSSIDAKISSFNSSLSKYSSDSQQYQQVAKSIENVTQAYKEAKTARDAYDVDMSPSNLNSVINSYDKLQDVIKKTDNEMKILKNEMSEYASVTQRINLTNNIQKWLDANTRATKEAREELESYIKEMNSAGNSLTKGRFNEISNAFKETTASMRAQGKIGKSFASEFSRAASQIGEFVGIYGILQRGVDSIGQMIRSVYDIDNAMTDLKMATGVTDDQANSLMETYAEMGNVLKATITDISASSTEWLKQGKSIQEAQKLTEDAIVLSKIGDLSSTDATKTITAYMKSYNAAEEEVMDFVDQISAIDMASATDVGGLATAFNEVAANARQAGVEAEKVLAYAATIGETTQEGMSSVGTSLNAIFSRMGNIKLSRLTDPETGEDLSNVETSLRNVGIELRASTGEFRDFDDVLDETASRWNSFSEVTQRSIAASFAGTNHLNEFMVLMQNYSSALEYMDIANESSGQSMEKFSAYQDSMAGKLEGLKNQFQQLSAVTFDSNFLKGLIDNGTTALGVITDLVDNFGILQSLFTVGGGILGAKGLGKSKNVMPFSIKLSKIIAA